MPDETEQKRPLWDTFPESIAPTTAMSPIPDAFTARIHEQLPDGRVTRRGRAAIVGALSPRFVSRWVVDGRTGERRRERVPVVAETPADAMRYAAAALEIAALDRDRDGRTQSLALSRIAERVYDVERLTGTDAVSWEQITQGHADSVAALLTHRNPADPVAALLPSRQHPRAASVWVDTSLWDDIAEMASHSAVFRPSVARFPVRLRLLKGQRRATDPQGTARELVAPHSDTGRYVWVGHRKVERGGTWKQERAKRARVRRTRAVPVAVADMSAGLTATIAAMPKNSAVTIAHDTHSIRVHRADTGQWNVTVKGPTGDTRRSNGRRSSDAAAAAIRDAVRATDPTQRAADAARAAAIR